MALLAITLKFYIVGAPEFAMYILTYHTLSSSNVIPLQINVRNV